MRRNKNIASFLFSAFSAGMLSQALMSSASGTDILETEKLVKEAKLQQNGSSTDDETCNVEQAQDIGANDNDDANSAGTVYIDRNQDNGALANKQLIKVASILLPTLGVGALNGSAYHFLKKEDKNKEPSEVNTEIKDEDEPNLEDTKGEKEDKNKEPSEVNTKIENKDKPNEENTKIKNENNKVTGNLNTSTSVWPFCIIPIVIIFGVIYYQVKVKSNTKELEIYDDYAKKLSKMLPEFNNILIKEPACVKITGKTIVVGDLHFNTGAALFVKKYYEKKVKEGYNLVFLGDFIDRGQQATYGTIFEKDGRTVDKKATAKWRLKTLEIIMDLKIKNPKKVIVLSGNHEADENTNYTYGFWEECKKAFGEVDGEIFFNKANAAFGELPKCAVLESKVNDEVVLNTFLVHGTVPYDPDGKMNLNGIVEKMSDIKNKKSYSIENKENGALVEGMLWNDYNGAGVRGDDVYNLKDPDVKLFKEANNIQRVISAHDHREPYVYHEDVNYIKVITSPNMDRKKSSDGYILDIDEHGNITQVKVKEISYETFKQQEASNISNIDNENFNYNFNNNNIFQNNN